VRPDPFVRLVVLNFNGGELTLRCVEHLRVLAWPKERLQVVVVDNASTDGSAEEVARRFPDVELRRNDRNGGFPANNLALRDLDGVDLVGLVNNDAFVEPGWLRALVDAMEAEGPDLGAVSSKLVLEPRFLEVRLRTPGFVAGPADPRTLGVMVRDVLVDGRSVRRHAHFASGGWGVEHDARGPFSWASDDAVLRVPAPGGPEPGPVTLVLQAERTKDVALDGGAGPVVATVGARPTSVEVVVGGDAFDVVNNVGSIVFEDGAGADRGWLERDEGQFDAPAEVFAWCGGSVLFRPAYLRDVGLFDEDFFLYYEDTDLSWRGRSRGWRYRTVPSSVARHVHAATSDSTSPLFAHHVERNRLLMLVKNAPAPMVLRQLWRYLLVTASYARRDVVAPLLRAQRPRPTVVRRRLGSLLDGLRLLPRMLRRRIDIRRRQVVPDAELLAWLVRR
jgi:GT2 family glycosyltransferase